MELGTVQYGAPEAGAAPKPQGRAPAPETAANAEPKKGRAPRLDGVRLLRRTFALEV